MRLQPKLEEGWSTLTLLWAMILVAGMAIMQSDLIDGLHIVPLAGSIGLLAGVTLAKSRFPTRTAHIMALVYGLFVVIYLTGNLLPEGMLWRERVFDIFNRQLVWLRKAIGGGTSRDGLIFVIQTSAIFWLLGYSAAWYTFRLPRVWRAIVPTGLVLLSVVYYYTGPRPLPVYLAIYVVLALVYLARTHLITQEKNWRETRVLYERAIRYAFIRASFMTALIALIVAWSLPTFSASPVVADALGTTRGPWRQFQDNWTRLFSALRAYGTDTVDPYQNTLVLGGPRTVGSTPIMDVYVEQKLPYVYWQAIVYDTYENGRWQAVTDYQSELHIPDDGVLPTPFTLSRQVVTQTVVTYLNNSSFLYAAPEPIGSNRQMFVEYTTDERGNMLVTAMRSRFILRQGDQYQVISRLSVADAQSLREAPTEYPDWVRKRYLQLPDTITPETVALAEELTAQYDNPYDKAMAVQNYLRENIKYNDQIPAPPDGIDPVHYTLFVSQEGYCNYYASAMTVMLRSQGIPARIVSGYAQGEFNAERNFYRVRASNAHTWVEVYFPGYGWIQFEPTASIPVITRPETAASGDDLASPSLPAQTDIDREALLGEEENQNDFERGGDVLDENALETTAPQTAVSLWQILGAILIVAIAGILLWVANKLNQRIEADVIRSYGRLETWARWLGIQFRPTYTPYERADMLTTVVPEGKQPIRNLTQQYVFKQFSKTHTPPNGYNPTEAWRELRPLLIRRGLIRRLEQWRTRRRR